MNTNEQNNPLMCNVETGICEIPGAQTLGTKSYVSDTEKPVRLIYFTDPICSSCWGIEAQLRKLKLEYGAIFTIEYRMGGLLKGWDSYGGRDVSNPDDVAKHWDEVGKEYEMPIDGDLWKEDPLHSSYPPSIAFKAAQLQDDEKALTFLRRIKEMVFLEKKNITRWEHLALAASEAGLDVQQLETDYHGEAINRFQEDLALKENFAVRGFPTIFFTDAEGNRLKLYGVKPYEVFEQTLLKIFPEAAKENKQFPAEKLIEEFPTLTTKEFAVLTGATTLTAKHELEVLQKKGLVTKFSTKNGDLWRRKNMEVQKSN